MPVSVDELQYESQQSSDEILSSSLLLNTTFNISSYCFPLELHSSFLSNMLQTFILR